MSGKILMKGNEACARGALLAGCPHYFGYPITPQTEIPEFFARHMPDHHGVFLQAESEIAAVSMVYGTAATGVRVMTSSSSPGPGSIQGAQSDYFQSTKGGGHGDYRLLTLAPNSAQEMLDMTMLGFELADQYRSPVLILSDGVVGQMMEPIELPEPVKSLPDKPWAATGAAGRERGVINTLHLNAEVCEAKNIRLQEKFRLMAESETRWEEMRTDDADWIIVAYGISARVALTVMKLARGESLKAGLVRPQTLWPLPDKPLRRMAERVRGFLAVEQSAGQMVEDVRLAVNGRAPVHFYGRSGGVMIRPEDVVAELRELARREGN